jgi:phosphoglycerol transferase MdoB-like AlkP superfamily enzyme
MLFENLNSHSILGVIYTTDKTVLLGILISLIFLILLFRTPKKINYSQTRNVGSLIIVICIVANLINFATAYIYPKVLIANGYDEECELEKGRNLSRNILSQSVTINLAREFLRNDESHVTASNQLYRVGFSEKETLLLSELGIEVGEKPSAAPNVFPYEKIIVIVAESFHQDYLHSYNSRIPAETTQFLDSLWAKYPHLDHYYTANKPTTQGLNSIFLSQLIYTDDQSFENNATLFKVLERNGYDTVFLEATSQYYNDEFRAYKKRFGMNIYRAKEDLEKAGYIGSSGWGFHNDVMYEETIRILDQNRNKKLFMVTKTIDSHQPYPYCGLSKEDIPAAINEQPNNVYLKGIYWENITLQKFFHDLEDRNLLDDKTLIIVTSDHNPHPSQNAHYKRLGEGDLSLTLAPIPLIFVSPNLQPFNNFSSATYASQIDFAPTLLGILGIPSPPGFSGRNMVNVPEERSYAVGFLGETIYYWSRDFQLKTDMYSEKKQNASEKALIHWVQDLHAKYFVGDSVRGVQ